MRVFSRKQGPTADLTGTWAACSMLLDYPTTDLVGGLDRIEVLATRTDLGGLIAHLRSGRLRALQEEYVETFDHARRCALCLTYYAYGATPAGAGQRWCSSSRPTEMPGPSGTRPAVSCPTTSAPRPPALLALWPLTRLVHVFSAPIGYLTRPYLV